MKMGFYREYIIHCMKTYNLFLNVNLISKVCTRGTFFTPKFEFFGVFDTVPILQFAMTKRVTDFII